MLVGVPRRVARHQRRLRRVEQPGQRRVRAWEVRSCRRVLQIHGRIILGPQISHNEQLFCWDTARSMVLTGTFNPWFESHQKFLFGKLADLTVNQSD